MNLPPPEAVPFDNITAKHFDSGDYPTCLKKAVDAVDLAGGIARNQRSRMVGGLASAFRSFANKGLMERRYMLVGAFPWSRGTNNAVRD